MSVAFQNQMAILKAACHRLHELPEDTITQEIVIRALTAFRPDPGDDAHPDIKVLARIVWHYGDMLKFVLEQAKTGSGGPAQIKNAAGEVCHHLAELEGAMEQRAKKGPTEER